MKTEIESQTLEDKLTKMRETLLTAQQHVHKIYERRISNKEIYKC